MADAAELAGKVALVTGGARTSGARSRARSRGGAAVMVNARTSRADAEEPRSMIRAAGRRAALHFADVTDPAAVSAMVEATIGEFGRLDFLVNNAAIRARRRSARFDSKDWQRVLATVLDGAFLCTQASLPHLARAGRGAVVNIGGLTGTRALRAARMS
jgi:3-oxoacyl-[acyl-carrier protein] reductase